MHLEAGLFLDIVIIFGAAFIGGLSARLLNLPVILGYMLMGMAIGPHGLRVIGNLGEVQTLAEFGVILLLFAAGIEVSFRELRSLGRSAVLIAVGQICVTIGFGFVVGSLLGWLPVQAVVLGMVLSLSSTMVVLKTLNDRSDLRSLHGRILTGVLLVQDLAFIPMIAVMPALSGDGGSFFLDLGIGIGKALGVLVAIALLGGKAIPWLLTRVAHLGSRETFILTLIAITFIISAITQSVGLSAAMGAFVAGLLLSESEFGYRALSEVTPIRDTFAAMFFVSLGMLTDPMFFINNVGVVLVVISLSIIVKFAVTTALARGFGYLPHTAALTGFGMIQIGEFSFILANTASTLRIVDDNFLPLIAVSAVTTMAITPAVMAGGERAFHLLNKRFSFLSNGVGQSPYQDKPWPKYNHTIISGMGRVGSMVARVLEEHQLPFIAIDINPSIVEENHRSGYHVIHGSSGSFTILEAASIKSAGLLVISTGDSASTWITAQQALELNPNIDIIARVYVRAEGERLQQIGVKEVVWPEMEAGLEILRHSLMRFHTDPIEIDSLMSDLRHRLSFGTETGPSGTSTRPNTEQALEPPDQSSSPS